MTYRHAYTDPNGSGEETMPMKKFRSYKAAYKATKRKYPRKPGHFCIVLKKRAQCVQVLSSGKLKFKKDAACVRVHGKGCHTVKKRKAIRVRVR